MLSEGGAHFGVLLKTQKVEAFERLDLDLFEVVRWGRETKTENDLPFLRGLLGFA